MTASAFRVEGKDTPTKQRMGAEWQRRALTYVDLVPEFSYASRFYSRMLKRVRIYPASRESDDQTKEITEGPAVELLDRIQDPGGGRSQIQGSYGRLMMITGEGYLFGRDLGDEAEKWSFVWTGEVEKNDDGEVLWKRSSEAEPVVYEPGQAELYRMWTPHPFRSNDPDSPMRANLEIAEELLILTKAVRSTAVTRMLNGILKVPSELSFGPAEGGVDDDPELDIFLSDWFEHITDAIENPGTAEAAAPFLVDGAAEYLEQLSWIKTHDPATDYMERDLRKEAVGRLAIGLDMPPEVLLGLADANHWTGRQIVHDMWRSHGAPIAEQLCDDLAEAYLRPALREAEEEWQNVVVAYDDAAVVVSPDRSEDADSAFDRGALGYKGYRKLKGIDEAMAPTPEEHEEYLALKMRDPQMLDEDFRPPGERGPSRDPEDNTDAEEGPPVPTNGRDVSREESRAASARIVGAAEMAVIRCRELAGSRLRTHQKAKPEVFEGVNGLPNAVVAATLGTEIVNELGGKESLELVKGGTEAFRSLLLGWGFSLSQAEALAEMVHVFAARTLFESEQPKLPSGFAAQVERMREVSHAVEGA